MKPIIPFALLSAFLAVGAQGAATDPVGYTTATISAAFSPTSPKNNVIAPDLENSASFAGAVDSVSTDQLVITGAAFTPNDFDQSAGFAGLTVYSYYIEAADGYWAQIVSNDATSVTVEAGAGANFTASDTITIRRHLTIADYFGALNETGLLADGVGDAGSADNIILIDEINGGTNTIFASTVLGPATTWVNDSFEDAGAFPIYPDQGVQVVRRGTTDLSVVLTGAVDLNGRQTGISTGVQIRPFTIPVDTTLNDLGLYTGDPATGVVGDGTGDPGVADIVTILTNGIPANYFYSTIDLGSGAGWYDDSFVAAPVIPAGSGLIINRSNPTNSSPFVWVSPGATVAP
ncbi:hypothetical protein [Haloferula sp.]|uniref:hypothetical protein n=1 Tax=Haloferula sp. TaxID=2497595 RepID=UPI00329F7898